MSSETPVSEVMTREVLTFAPTDQAHEAMETMVDRGIGENLPRPWNHASSRRTSASRSGAPWTT